MRNTYAAHKNSKAFFNKPFTFDLGEKTAGIEAIKYINAALNWIQKKHFNSTTTPIPLGDIPTGNILALLYRGKEAINQENDELRERSITRKFRDCPDWLFPRIDNDQYFPHTE